ncbi:MAG: bifunctional adenosylcobinamide kinase/adenosylcobinamide-phosphate guanylyltransferase [Thermodesulfobacteriota bacterium]
MEKRMIFITGGCRSGKSRYALHYANQHFSKKLFLATSEPLDEEMAQRIENHKKVRGPEWQTIEEPVDIVNKIKEDEGKSEVILTDCLTLWLYNLLMRWDNDLRIMEETERLIDSLKKSPSSSILVSNEVGLGIVPADPLSRRYRDLLGAMNQRIAGALDTVIFMVSGIPLFLKGKE